MTDAVTKIPNEEEHGDNIEPETEEIKQNDTTETKEANTQPTPAKQRSVSFNKDVHVKRFGKPREARGASSEHQQPTIRREPFTHLSKQELIEEANKVLAQADSVSCTTDHSPDKFFSLPYRKKAKQDSDRSERRNSEDSGSAIEPAVSKPNKAPLGRSTSDVTARKKAKERTSLSTLFRRANRNTSPDAPIVVPSKPNIIVKRSKSDVTDLKSNTDLNPQPKPIRKRSGSESEEFLRSLRNKKTQLSPIIESSPREDYFKKISPLVTLHKENTDLKEKLSSEKTKPENSDIRIINPVEKPPRFKTPEKCISDPKPPIRSKRSKSPGEVNNCKPEKKQLITDTPKRKTEVKKTLLVDEIDRARDKDHPVELKDRIKDSIKKIQDNIYGAKEMIHSSQQPPDKPLLTKGNTVDHIVKILKEDQQAAPPKAHLITPPNNGNNSNQPFSYTRPSVSPDPNLYLRSTSPERPKSPVNKMNREKGVVYAQVVRGDQNRNGINNVTKQTVHKTYSPSEGRYKNLSDEDEGLGYEERHKVNKFTKVIKYDYDLKKTEDDNLNGLSHFKAVDSPITPRFKEFRLTTFDEFEPTYANEYPLKDERTNDFVDTTFRGQADGMDAKRKTFIEPEAAKIERLDFNELSHRRELLESRLNARRIERDGRHIASQPITRYLTETDPLLEAENKMKATEKYVNETARYYRHTLERDGYVENNVSDQYSKFDSGNAKIKYNTESRTFEKVPVGELDRRTFLDKISSGDPKRSVFSKNHKEFPPEPEYEPPSLESNVGKPLQSPEDFSEKKFKAKSRTTTSSNHETIHTGQKYTRTRDDRFGKRKGHYSSNPEIAQEREEEYVNAKYDPKYTETYHNSLRRDKSRERNYQDNKYYPEERNIHRHGSSETRDNAYRDAPSPRGRYDNDRDNRLVDSGIENDFRKDSSGEIHRTNKTTYNTKFRTARGESDEEACTSSMFIASERRHTEDNNPSEQIYANGDYHSRFDDYVNDEYPKKPYMVRERSIDDGSHFDPRLDRFDKSSSALNEKVSAKPPKAVKKLSGLEKVKQLFSRDSSKKSKKEKEEVQTKNRTRVLKSPEHLAVDPDFHYKDSEVRDDLHKRYKEYRGSSDERESELKPKKYHDRYLDSGIPSYRTSEQRRSSDERYNERRTSDERYSEHKSPRPSDVESELKSSRETSRKSRSKTADPLDSPRLAEHYRGRRRLATPSPTPSPPRRSPPEPLPKTTAGNWFKSLDRLSRKRAKSSKVEKESGITTGDESTATRKTWNKQKPLNSPAKNLRFFGDTDQDSDANVSKHTVVTKSKSHPQNKGHALLRKTTSNSSNGIDEIDHSELSNKSYSLTNLHEEPKTKSERYNYKSRNLHNISEIHSNSETEVEESHVKPRKHGSKVEVKPPMSPYDRRSRSHSSSKNVKTQVRSKSDLKGYGRDYRDGDVSRGSSSELRGSKQELSGSRGDLKLRRRTPGTQSGESSTEGESSHQSQRSVVYLHATTVGDIPNPGRITRGRSRDDVSSVNSSQIQVKTVAKSFSLFAPWTPRHQGDRDVHYNQAPNKRSHRTPDSSIIGRDKPGTLQKNRSASQSTLTKRPKPTASRLSSSNNTLYKKPEKKYTSSSKENINTTNIKSTTMSRTKHAGKDKKSVSTEVLSRDSDRDKISRSISMPKDNSKKAGWFKLTNKNKKPETTSRVR